MKLIKKIISSKFFREVIAFLGAYYIKFVYRTSKIDYINKNIIENLVLNNKVIICVFWHGKMALMPYAWMWKKPFFMLSSQHRDGILINRVLKHFNIQSISGSQTRGGIRAGISIINALKQGFVIGITPDGPRGPSQKCSKSVITLAQIISKRLGEVYIVPATYNVSRKKQLSTWDRFVIPFPFSKGYFKCSEPIHIKGDQSLPQHTNSLRIALENRMNDLEKSIQGA